MDKSKKSLDILTIGKSLRIIVCRLPRHFFHVIQRSPKDDEESPTIGTDHRDVVGHP